MSADHHRHRDRFLHIRGGVSSIIHFLTPADMVFSTYVEVFLEFAPGCAVLKLFSPHTWRCFRACRFCRQGQRVFSTYVEVFLPLVLGVDLLARFLHIRGGVS